MSTYALKFVMFALKVPSAFNAMLPDVLIVLAMLTLPHSAFVFGLCTSLRTGVPFTPKAGEMIACALAWSEILRRDTTTARTVLEYISASKGRKLKEGRVKLVQKDS